MGGLLELASRDRVRVHHLVERSLLVYHVLIMSGDDQLAHQLDMLHTRDLARAQDLCSAEIVLVARSKLTRLFEKLAVEVTRVTFLLARQSFASRVDPHEEVDDVRQISRDLDGLKPVIGDEMLQTLTLEINPVDPPRLLLPRRSRPEPKAIPLLNAHEEE